MQRKTKTRRAGPDACCVAPTCLEYAPGSPLAWNPAYTVPLGDACCISVGGGMVDSPTTQRRPAGSLPVRVLSTPLSQLSLVVLVHVALDALLRWTDFPAASVSADSLAVAAAAAGALSSPEGFALRQSFVTCVALGTFAWGIVLLAVLCFPGPASVALGVGEFLPSVAVRGRGTSACQGAAGLGHTPPPFPTQATCCPFRGRPLMRRRGALRLRRETIRLRGALPPGKLPRTCF